MIVFGRPSSLNTQRVLWCLHEVGAAFSLRLTSATLGPSGRLDGSKAFGVDAPDFLRASPFRQIPALVDNDVTIWESASIIRYLAEVYHPSLIGQDAGARAHAAAWMDYHLSTFSQGAQIYSESDFMGNLMTHLVRLPADGSPVPVTAHGKERGTISRCRSTIAKAAAQAETQFSRIDKYLARTSNDYILGDRFSVADIPLGTEFNRWRLLNTKLQSPIASTLALDAWYERLVARPAFVKGVVEPEEAHHHENRFGVSGVLGTPGVP